MDRAHYIQAVRRWLESMVIGLNLCPFAKREMVRNRIRITVSEAVDEAGLLSDLHAELDLLAEDRLLETTLLIHPMVLNDFNDYNTFLDLADALLRETDMEGRYQIASFHPDYQFADSETDDLENYTNRSPFPLLHLIDEQTLEQRIAAYPDTENIPAINITTLKELGREKVEALLNACKETASND